MCRVISQQELNRSIISIEISKEMMPIRMCGLYILDVPFSHPIVQEAITKNAKKWMKDINGNKFCIGKNWIRWGMQDMPVCLRLWGFFLFIQENRWFRHVASLSLVQMSLFLVWAKQRPCASYFRTARNERRNNSLRILDPYEFDFDVG